MAIDTEEKEICRELSSYFSYGGMNFKNIPIEILRKMITLAKENSNGS